MTCEVTDSSAVTDLERFWLGCDQMRKGAETVNMPGGRGWQQRGENLLDRAERLDPAYRRSLDWYCPAGCHVLMVDADNGMRCLQCDTHWTWAALMREE